MSDVVHDPIVAHKLYMDGDQLIVSEISASEFYKPETIETQLIFECIECKAIHDPETISFAKLLESAKSVGWQIKWLDMGYEMRCTSCLHKS